MAQSFYGGKQGFSFLIRKAFPSIEHMIEAFQQGPNYADVNFNEHVIIDTVNKNNPDNGKVFRRGYNYTDDDGGAIYVGQIVGPSGHAPTMEIAKYEDVKQDSVSEYTPYTSEEINAIDPENCYIYKNGKYQFISDISSKKVEGDSIMCIASDGSQYRLFKHNGSSVLRSETTLSVNDNGLVAGSKDNEEIKIAFLSVRDAEGEETKLKVGLQIPYHTFDFTAKHSTGPVITRQKDSNAFYSNYHFNLMPSDKIDLIISGEEDEAQHLVKTRTTYSEKDGVIEEDVKDPIAFDIKWIKGLEIDGNHNLTAIFSDLTKKALGSVREGIIIGGDVSSLNISGSNAEQIITALNASNSPDKNKCYTWTAANGEKFFFAYDSVKKTWYYIGSLNRVHHYFGEAYPGDSLSSDGIWFVTED